MLLFTGPTASTTHPVTVAIIVGFDSSKQVPHGMLTLCSSGGMSRVRSVAVVRMQLREEL